MTMRYDDEWDDDDWIAAFMPEDHACACLQYELERQCPHLRPLRRETEVKVDPRYL